MKEVRFEWNEVIKSEVRQNGVEWSGWKGVAEPRWYGRSWSVVLAKTTRLWTTRHKLVRFGESG